MPTDRNDYDFAAIERRWQDHWQREKTFRAIDFDSRPKFYALDMFPYPSGAGLHIGHPEGYTATDILCRARRAQGHNVLHPMGWDAFGLPAEQYAIQTGRHPRATTSDNIANFRRQIQAIGFAIDWDREVNTTDPAYFRWTQWIFLVLFKRGLAYVDRRPVWWCEELKTVLANEEIIDGRSERGDHPVERRALRQWILRITAYAETLLKGLEDVEWPESTKTQQINWIGRSEGAEVVFALSGFPSDTLTVYTTRPDTLFGATYMVLAPEHPLVGKLTTGEQQSAVKAYVEAASRKSDLDRTDLAKEKSGVFTGSFAINPVNGARIPVWVADYVLMSYGTGAIMAVPAHDERDYAFAEAFNLPIQPVIEPRHEDGFNGAKPSLPYVGSGVMVHSDGYTGLDSEAGRHRITADLEAAGKGRAAVNYKLRDWLFSRQRYWGEPTPIVWVDRSAWEAAVADRTSAVGRWTPEEPVSYVDEDSGEERYALPVPPEFLPLELPETESYEPSGMGESPLANVPGWVRVWYHVTSGETVSRDEPRPDGDAWVPATRETNTMPQWAGSCWYYLRYCDPENADRLIDPDKEQYWGVPDLYIGGAEHAVLHLLYARFWHQVLHDEGVVTHREPFSRLIHQGLILGEMEYALLLDDEGNPVSTADVEDPNPRRHAHRKLSEADVEKEGAFFVWKEDPAIRVDARAYKMSKSRGNVVNPDDVIREYGADSLRLYEMFLGPLQDSKPWNARGIEGVSRFLRRSWREIVNREGAIAEKFVDGPEQDESLSRVLHETIQKVTADIDGLKFNTAISQLMIFLSALQDAPRASRETAKTFVQLLAPFAPHIAEELWERLGEEPSVVDAPWPKHDPAKLVESTVKLIFQVNGKVRGNAQAPKGIAEEDAVALARANERVAAQLDGKTVRKVIFVPDKIVNIVAG